MKHFESGELLENPWDNVYWFARALINSDQFGGIGRDTKTMLKLTSALKETVELTKSESDDKIVNALHTVLKKILLDRRKDTKKFGQIGQLCDFLSGKLLSPKDFHVLALTCEKIMVPINKSLDVIPDDDPVLKRATSHPGLKNYVRGMTNFVEDLQEEVT